MRKLFIGNKNYSSWSLRPWVLMRALCIPFEEVLVPFDGVDNYQRFKAFAPNGLVPCLEDDQGVVWDSMAITEVLAEDHPEVWPIDRAARRFARAAAAAFAAGSAAASIGTAVKSVVETKAAAEAALAARAPAAAESVIK